MSEPDPSEPPLEVDPSSAIIVHFYRAVVMHMDVWRQRMDATTNWAAAATAAMVTFSFSAPDTPHFTLLLAAAFDVMFLLMESRRYQIFDLWRRRFRLLNRHVVAPALGVIGTPDPHARAAAFQAIGVELGRLVPHLSLAQAVGYRIRRNYGYVFTIVGIAWLLKLEVHPTAAASLQTVVDRASIGLLLPGGVVMLLVLACAIAAAALGLAAPTERMVDWADQPSPYQRLLSRSPRSGD